MRLGISFVFVAHGGEIEVKAALLAASLRRFVAADHELIAAVPEPVERWGALSPETEALFAHLNIKIFPIRNEISDDYPIGNKVTAIGVPATYDRTLFLDSDILMLRPFYDHSNLVSGYAAKPADLDTFSHAKGDWKLLYELFKLPLPKERVIASFSGERMMPYYNAGVICCRDNQRFSALWLQVCQRIEAEPKVNIKRPWLDQMALPIAVELAGVPLKILGEELNYPAHRRDVDVSEIPYLCHYHTPDIIQASTRMSTLVSQLCFSYPRLAQLLNKWPQWQELVQPSVVS